MTALYSSMDPSDKIEVTTMLNQWGISYSQKENDIFVKENEARAIRMRLASEGIPTKGSLVGYELFNKSDTFGTSSFLQDVNLLRALEGELARTIMSFEHIKAARIHLVIPKRELFNNNKNHSSASVVVKVKDGNVLSKKDVFAISHIVASAVSNMSPNDVTIVGTDGQSFKLGNSDTVLSSSIQEYKFDHENRMRESIENLVEKAVGIGKVRAEVFIDMDFDQMVIDSEKYDSEPITRSIHTSEEKNVSKDNSKNVSVENNMPFGDSGSSSDFLSNFEKNDETINYEISKEIKKHIISPGVIKRVSVGVLIDGVYSFDKELDKEVYKPRSENEMARIRKLIVSASGIDTDRGDTVEVINMQFIHPEVVEYEENWFENTNFYSLASTLIISLVVLLISILVVRPIINSIIERVFLVNQNPKNDSSEISDDTRNISGNGDVDDNSKVSDLTDINSSGNVLDDGLNRLNDLVASNPDAMVDIIRFWMKKDQK